MGRTTAGENKSEWFRFRIKPSLRKRILEVQALGDCSDLELQDFIVVLIRRGLKVQERLMEWQGRLTLDEAKEASSSESKGGAARQGSK